MRSTSTTGAPHQAKHGSADEKSTFPSDHFASNVFGVDQIKRHLPKPMFSDFLSLINDGKPLKAEVADAVAHAARIWAMEKGATHFTHWFQPVNGSTAEKHDSFLSFAYTFNGTSMEPKPIDAFSGSQLVQAEPDASSFPNGGMRNTFEARGYTVWDTTSAMFVREGALGTFVLYIPSVFISYNGEALDEKTVLLRSSQALSRSAVHLLRTLGDHRTKSVHVNLGVEQEFFLVDEANYNARPDLQQTGRTLVGRCPPKTQQLSDHYFGSIPTRVLAAITDAEQELLKLGVPIKTRHNEVAPAQFEMAPVFEEAHVAVDHNLLTMNVLHSAARKHGLVALFHEKPFRGVNGSGKHCNWSVSTNEGKNLLEPGQEPKDNIQFLCFLVATILAVHDYATLLRASIASCSNEHRLGAHEAPPSIISVFLGSQLNAILESIEKETFHASPNIDQQNLQELKKKFVSCNGCSLDLNIAVLPAISRDLTDRNRTSPFAFTGNKFEFRAVGSNQSPSFPVTILNCAVAISLERISAKLQALQREQGAPNPVAHLAGHTGTCSLRNTQIISCLREFILESKAVRFEGNGYSEKWVKEAKQRGLPNVASAPEAFEMLLEAKNAKLLTATTEVFTPDELNSRYHILMETFVESMLIEANNLVNLFQQKISYAALQFKREILQVVQLTESISLGGKSAKKEADSMEQDLLESLTAKSSKAHSLCKQLKSEIQLVESNTSSNGEKGRLAHSLGQSMRSLRGAIDELEELVPDSLWPLCKYAELFFSVK